jgi:hypothetical protein
MKGDSFGGRSPGNPYSGGYGSGSGSGKYGNRRKRATVLSRKESKELSRKL